MFSGAELKCLFPNAKTRYAIIKRLTANAGIASVAQRPIENKSRKITYVCDSVKPGSFNSQVIARANTKESRKLMTFLRLTRKPAAVFSVTTGVLKFQLQKQFPNPTFLKTV